jgi:hypothetical protein
VRQLKNKVALLLCLGVAGCGLLAAHPSGLQARRGVHSGPVYTGPFYAPRPSEFPVIGADGPVLGVNLWAKQDYPAAQVRRDGIRMLSYLKNVLHAGAVDIVWNFFAPGYHGSRVAVTPDTLTAANVAILTGLAERYHLQVEYRPMMFVLGPVNNWEGMISPASQPAWFASYYQANLPYLRVAQKYRVSEYILGTEMDGVSRSPLWNGLLIKSAEIYRGELSYADHQSLYFPPDTQLPPVRLAGLDMYEPLDLPPGATLDQVTAAYEHYFTDAPASLLHRTAIDETGIAARRGAYREPSFMFLPGQLDPLVQAYWYTAACRAAQRFRLRGVFYWKVDLADNPAHPATSLSTFEGRPAALAITGCAASLATGNS